MSDRAVLVASVGEISAQIRRYDQEPTHFVVSSIARGGFSGAPVQVAYDEGNISGGTAVLGLVTQSLVHNSATLESGFMAVISVDPIYACLRDAQLLPNCQE